MRQNILINGVQYSDVPEMKSPKVGGGEALFFDTTDADAARGNVLSGKTYYKDGKKTGSMPNNGAQTGTISTKAGSVTIAEGYHNGSGSVQISSTEQRKIIAGNIRSGVSILGQSGDSNVVNTGDADRTAGNILQGKTAYVGGTKITGTLSAVSVSQDPTTKVVTIE